MRFAFVCLLSGFVGMGCGSDDTEAADKDENSNDNGSSTSSGNGNSDSTSTNGTSASADGSGGSSNQTNASSNDTTTSATGGSAGSDGTPTGTTGSQASPSLEGCEMFPEDNPWNTDISAYPVHPDSDDFIDSIGRDGNLHPDFGTEWEGSPIGIPYTTVDSGQAKVPVEFNYDEESDPGPYPIPPDAPIEGGPDADGDRHVLVVDTDACILYELFNAQPEDGGSSWYAG